MQRLCDVIVLLQSWTASQDFREPELANCTLHVPNLALSGRRSSNPLRRFSAYTTHHVGVGQGLRGTLTRLLLRHDTYHGLSNAGMQR